MIPGADRLNALCIICLLSSLACPRLSRLPSLLLCRMPVHSKPATARLAVPNWRIVHDIMSNSCINSHYPHAYQHADLSMGRHSIGYHTYPKGFISVEKAINAALL